MTLFPFVSFVCLVAFAVRKALSQGAMIRRELVFVNAVEPGQ
jgi:hypothetical protein